MKNILSPFFYALIWCASTFFFLKSQPTHSLFLAIHSALPPALFPLLLLLPLYFPKALSIPSTFFLCLVASQLDLPSELAPPLFEPESLGKAALCTAALHLCQHCTLEKSTLPLGIFFYLHLSALFCSFILQKEPLFTQIPSLIIDLTIVQLLTLPLSLLCFLRSHSH